MDNTRLGIIKKFSQNRLLVHVHLKTVLDVFAWNVFNATNEFDLWNKQITGGQAWEVGRLEDKSFGFWCKTGWVSRCIVMINESWVWSLFVNFFASRLMTSKQKFEVRVYLIWHSFDKHLKNYNRLLKSVKKNSTSSVLVILKWST